jgi:hypothetical protein
VTDERLALSNGFGFFASLRMTVVYYRTLPPYRPTALPPAIAARSAALVTARRTRTFARCRR